MNIHPTTPMKGPSVFTTIALAVLLIAAVAGFAVFLTSKDSDTTGAAGAVAIIAAIVFLIWGGFSVLYFVSATEVGVPLTLGNIGQPVGPGWHAKAPWSSVETLPTRPFPVADVEIKARTAQGGSVTVTAGARWSVDRNRADDTYRQVRTGDEDKISADVVDKLLGMAVGNVYSKYDNAGAVSNRLQAETDLKAELSRLMESYGIRADNAFVRQVEPDQATSEAIARYTAQQNATRIALEANNTAVAQAAQRLTEAQGLTKAAAAIPSNLTPEQVQALCVQAWERQVTKATEAHVPLYVSPCGGVGLPVTVPSK